MRDIYGLKLGETVVFARGIITRVPGGWVYERTGHSLNTLNHREEVSAIAMIFIPWSDEFQVTSLNKDEVKEQ